MNSSQKTVLETYKHFHIWRNYHIWLVLLWNRHHHWIHIKKQCKSMPISCMTTIYHLDYIINVTVEFQTVLETYKHFHIWRNYHIWLVWLWNGHHHWICIEKWCKSMPISCMTTIYRSDYIINVTVEFPSKNGAGNI